MKTLFTGLLLFIQFQVFAQFPADSLATDTATHQIKNSFAKKASKQTWTKQNYIDFHKGKILVLKSSVVVAAASGLGLATYQLADEPLREFTLDHRTETTSHISKCIEPLGRSGVMMPASGVLYATGFALKNKNMQRAAILSFLSMAVNDFATLKLKREFQRHRPDISAENNLFDGGEGGRHNTSLPSAHTSTAFTVATSVATVYKDSKLVPPLAYGTAALVGLSRIHDNKHWATDVLAGAAVGFISAKTTYFFFRKTEKLLEKKGIQIYMVPNVNTRGAGLSAGITF